jgi:hypothetical protein
MQDLGFPLSPTPIENWSERHRIRRLSALKMQAAKRLLLQESLSVKETAARLGYSSEFQFSRCFTRMEGRSPSAHVRAMTEKGAPQSHESRHKAW